MPLRPLAIGLITAVILALTGCGSDDNSEKNIADQVAAALTISGEVGMAPKITWNDQITSSDTYHETLVTGDGDQVKEGDTVLARLWLGNGFTMKEATNGAYSAQATSLTISRDSLSGAIVDAVVGQPVGSRVLIVASTTEIFGDASGGTSSGFGNQDPVVIVMDVTGVVPGGPSGKTMKAPAWAPTVTTKDDVPTGMDFTGVPAPGNDLKVGYLIKGTGPKLTSKDTSVIVNYLGQVYRGKKPFDASYDSQPFTMSMQGGVVEGWTMGLKGVPVGSRVVLSIPPALGYGKEGRKPDIQPDDTMFFVIDVLAKG